MSPPDVVPLDYVDFNFTDVFGPLPVQTSHELSHRNCINSVPVANVSEIIYDDPKFIYSSFHGMLPTQVINNRNELYQGTKQENGMLSHLIILILTVESGKVL